MDMNYLLLYLEENYGLTSEKRCRAPSRLLPMKTATIQSGDYLNSLQWDGTERIRYALHHFLGSRYGRIHL